MTRTPGTSAASSALPVRDGDQPPMKSPAEEVWFALMAEVQRQKAGINALPDLESVTFVVKMSRGKAARVLFRTESQAAVRLPEH